LSALPTLGVLILPVRDPPQLSACADVTARRSVTHLTFADTFWRSVQTCSVLLRTEAGGTPAFQSVAATRQFFSLSALGKFFRLLLYFRRS
jgi:hypothetical protein